MKGSLQMIFDKYPKVKEKFYNNEIQLSTNQEDVFYQLCLFMNEPDKYSFNISLLYQFLEDNELIFALQTISFFFRNDTYLIKEKQNLLIKDVSDDIELFNQQMFSDYLSNNGFNFSPQKVNTYKRRGIIPQGDISIGGKPYWLKETVEQYLRELKQNKN